MCMTCPWWYEVSMVYEVYDVFMVYNVYEWCMRC